VDQAKNNLLSAFNALNGDEKLNALKDEVNNLTHLSETQRNQIKDLISNSDSLAAASEILEKAKELNQAIGNLKTKIQDAKAKKQDDIYTCDTSEKKQAFDQAITASETALGNYESASLDALNATQLSEKANAVNTDISTLGAAINRLDGKRQALRNEINTYDSELISADEKQTYITQINSLNQKNPETTDSKQILDEAFAAAKDKAKEIVSGLGNLSEADKKKYKDLLEAAVKGTANAPDSNLKTILEQAKRDNNAKQEAIERIKDLDSLTKEQKDEFEKQIKEAETSEVLNIENTATDLNTAIPAAKEKLAQLQAKKDEIKYKWADLTNKNHFDGKLQALNNLITSTGATKKKLEEAESNLDNSYNALNGDTKHDQLNAKIDQLTNLDANQRKQLKDKIVTFDDYEKAAALVNNAQTINDAIKKLEEKIADANTAKADEVYTLDEQTKKTVFDTALSHANDKLSEYKNLNLTTLDNDSTTTKKAQIEKEVSDLDTEINKLDGYRHAFKESLKGKWHLLTDNDLAPLNAMVDKPDFPEKPEAVNKEE
ncbi:GA module-containing protein, partial [Mycoplasmopsis pullorum]